MAMPGGTPGPSAVIIEVEREMAEQAAELFDRTVEQMIGFVPAQATFAERCHVVEGLIEANPTLHESVDRLAVLGVFLGAKDRRPVAEHRTEFAPPLPVAPEARPLIREPRFVD